ncbi:pyroglutamyl-peptidase I [Helcococcus kunzii]|uniref:pyroglutamyl-peptidase I n=1 Tax=Helcococcus kunzii TaxID=40091 RepID=UPI0021A68078|nr:pyroglutamyl-peptidase I [Helcococcus kunzii]MCT1795960.1 pyroglutamyl-peptidase I [Helcococcus kunzii]MCT1988264.1 pyroglutamyl-peptidase I [Helcococcus kunzii]
MKILLTAFDPFGGEKVNPALEAVKMVEDEIKGAEIVKLEIPTVFKEGPKTIFDKIEEINPDVVLSIGQAGGRSALTVEFVGINWADGRIADNEGNQPTGEKIFEDGETAYFTTLPVKGMVENIRKHEIPAHMSYTAGTFVCNDVLYSVLYYIDKHNKKIKSGFMHVPFAADQVVDKANGTPFMSLEMIAQGITHAIEAIVELDEDIDVNMGQTQ